jgi:hypothetical protein
VITTKDGIPIPELHTYEEYNELVVAQEAQAIPAYLVYVEGGWRPRGRERLEGEKEGGKRKGEGRGTKRRVKLEISSSDQQSILRRRRQTSSQPTLGRKKKNT